MNKLLELDSSRKIALLNDPFRMTFLGGTVADLITSGDSALFVTIIPGVGKSIAQDLVNIGINAVSDLKGRDPYELFDQSNLYAGCVQDRCLLYVFKCAVYFAETPTESRDAEKLKWWNWKDGK